MTLESQNRYVLNLVQALIGAITPSMRLIGLRFGDPLTLCFLLEIDRQEDRDEIDDIVFEFRALLDDPLMDLSVEIVVSDEPLLRAMPSRPDRVVFSRKTDELV